MIPFDANNQEHVAIVEMSFPQADAFGLGYFTNAKNVLEMHDIKATLSDLNDIVQRHVCETMEAR